MSDALARHRKECEEMKLAAMVWWLILWYASDEGQLEIPAEQQWLVCELTAAIIEEVTGEKFWYSWRHGAFNQERYHRWNEWPSRLNTEIDQCDRRFHHWFDGSDVKSFVRGLIKRFVRQRSTDEPHGRGYNSDLKLFHQNNTPTAFGYSRFTPSREMAATSIRFLGEQGIEMYSTMVEWCHQIGTLMRPYIERDIAYIKKNCSW